MTDFIEIIKEQVINNPNSIAVIDGDYKIKYPDFLDLCYSFSHSLRLINEAPKIVIDLNQSIKSYALIIAVLHVGGTFCPLDINAPIERKKHIIGEFKPDLIVVETDKINIEYDDSKVISIDDLLQAEKINPINKTYNEDSIVFVIYTSGSTGMPKGVKICRKALCKFLEWSIPTYDTGVGEIWGQFSLLSFDLSIVDIFTCLCSGATLLVMSDPASKLRPSSIIEKQKISIWHSVPSVVDFMIKSEESRQADFSSLRLLSFCGEPLKKYYLDFLFKKNRSTSVFNTYGPTEGTLFCTWKEFRKDDYLQFHSTSMSIGIPIPGWNLYLKSIHNTDEKELIIYGDYIGKGYIGNPHQDNFNRISIEGKFQNVFETGDLVKVVDGHLYYSCRKDRQVKIMGHRIELDEIDVWIRQYVNKQSVTIVHNNALYSFVEAETISDENALRLFLSQKLEEYKIPRAFYTIKNIPRNANLKVNIKALIELLP